MTAETTDRPSSVPPWVARLIWFAHRRLYAVTRGRIGLRRATANRWGMLRLTTVGRKSGRSRVAIVGFIEDGPNLVTPAMNGWLDPDPAWWLNLQANPEASVELPDGSRHRVLARAAVGSERDRLWQRWLDLKSMAFTEENAALRSRETALVVLEPRSG